MDARTVSNWLTHRVATTAGLHPDEVACDLAFSSYGLDSADVVAISGELAELLDRPVDPTALFDYPTIDDLVDALFAPRVAPQIAARAHVGWSPGPVAIVGLACRVPGAASVAELWDSLMHGRDAVGTVPPGRWPDDSIPQDSAISHGGFLDRIEDFDAEFFRIPRQEALRMDPQQRVLLEVAMECFEDAGVPLDRLRGSRTGVFVGISGNDYLRRQLVDDRALHALTPTGSALSIAANRLSYCFDLRGPSIAIDTACSSSLVAMHLAVRSLRAGECDQAIVAGVNLLVEPEISLALERAGMLAPDGRCKTFSAEANGYGRGEGCGAALLRPIEHARRAHDRIYATVLGSAVNQDGRTNGLTAPNPAAQLQVLAEAYADAGVDPTAVQYVECHGSGTLLGDPIEAKALGEVVGRERDPDRACLIGSIKANLGHLEAAAGIAGVLKTALALHHGRIPASLHCASRNPHIAFAELGLDVVHETRDWPDPGGERRAGVSGFGFGGTNAHVVLGAADGTEEMPAEPARAPRPFVLPVSARSAGAFADAARALSERVRSAAGGELLDVVATAATRRSHHPVRGAVVGDTPGELADALTRLASSPQPARRSGRPRIGFVFSGQGSTWVGMGRSLLRSEPVFRSTVKRCDEALSDRLDCSILDVLADDRAANRLDDIAVATSVVFAVQAGLVAVWKALGVEPDAVVGHSLGEIAAAFAAGALTLDEAAGIAEQRGRSMAPTVGRGRMLAIGANEAEADALAAAFGDDVDVAAVNGPETVVLAGDVRALREIEARYDANGRFARWLPASVAFHSAQMDEAAANIECELEGKRFARPTIPVFSTVTGSREEDALMQPTHWARSVRETVRFADAVGAMLDDGIDAVVEVGPSHALRTPLRQIIRAREGAVPVLSTMHRGIDDRRSLLEAAAELYGVGADLAWHRLAPSVQRVAELPSYPWQQQRHWMDRTVPAGRRAGHHPLLGARVELAAAVTSLVWEAELAEDAPGFLTDHRVLGSVVLPGSAYVEIILAAARGAGMRGPLAVTDLSLRSFITLEHAPRRVQTTLTPDGRDGFDVEIHARRADSNGWTLHAVGHVSACDGSASTHSVADARVQCLEQLPPPLFYASLRERGLEYGPQFRTVQEIFRQEGEALATIVDPGAAGFELDPRILDGALQLLAAAAGLGLDQDLYVPVEFGRLTYSAPPSGKLTAHVTARRDPASGPRGATADIVVLDDHDGVCCEVENLRLEQVDLHRRRDSVHRVWTYGVVWRTAPARLARPMDGRRVLVLADRPTSDDIVEGLRAAGASVGVAHPGAAYSAHGNDTWSLQPDNKEDYERLFRDSASTTGPFDTLVHSWELTVASPGDPNRAAALAHSLAAVIRAASFAGVLGPSELWVVTRGSHAVTALGELRDPFAAVLWGIAKALPFENPALRCRCVDLAPGSREVATLVAELSSPSDDAEIALRGDERYVRRLTRETDGGVVASPGVLVDPAATYLVTGGLGALGLHVARTLAAKGARRLALLGRRGARDECTAELQLLKEAGVEVVIEACDVASRDDVAAALASIRAPDAPLRGIVHAAGVLDDGPLLSMTNESLDAVLAPKVAGAWWLHELTAGDPLDWLVYFSSAASLLGSPGQSNYCGANAFLDTFVDSVRERVPDAVVVNWGPWGGGGLADGRDGYAASTGSYATLAPEDALAALDLVMVERRPRTLVLPFDLHNLLQFFPVGLGLPFFEDVLTEETAALRSIGAGSSPVTRPELDHEYVTPRTAIEEQIASIWRTSLGIDRVGAFDGFFELGGDSVFANEIITEINRALAVSLDVERAFEDFTVANLALLAEAFMIEHLQSLSDDEATRLLSSGTE
ncbi:MAG: SDR family NAD(P)-dependent oxidoreductase [Actinomycetota bacterium]